MKFCRTLLPRRKLPESRVVAADPHNKTLPHLRFRRAVSLLVLFFAASVLTGCRRKHLGAAEIRAITHDLVAAAQSAAGPHARISIRPEMGRVGNGPPYLVADDIFIDLPDANRRSTIEQALDRAAARHRLTRVSQPGSPNSIHFDYLLDGKRTHSIHIVIAAPAERASGLPRLAIIIDDIGNDKSAADALLKMPHPLTLSVLPGQSHSTEIAGETFRRGDQVMLHLPMEFQGNAAKAEAVELRVGMSAGEVHHLLDDMLAQVPHAVGVNNHEGSLATAQPQLMAEVMEDLRRRNLFFIDSRTTVATVAYNAAKQAGVPAASRKVFLDDIETRESILRQLDLAVHDAVENGSAIAIGHPHPVTIAALAEGLPRLKSRVRIVFASALVR
ncbi:MAG: divergent polysaccharide deacetylase family protein [Candidatus Acidiferrales bacterium]